MDHESRLTPRQTRFVSEYLVDLNATQAAIRAGYSPRSDQVTSSRLLSNAMVQAHIAAAERKSLEKSEVTATRVIAELARLAFADTTALFDAQNRLKPFTALSPAQKATIAKVETVIRNVSGADGHTDTVLKVTTHDKVRALEMLAKHLGLLKTVVEVENVDALVARLESARRRVKR